MIKQARILAIDQGTTHSGVVVLDVELAHPSVARKDVLVYHSHMSNADILADLDAVGLRVEWAADVTHVVIEKFACYGNPVGADTLETVHFGGYLHHVIKARLGVPVHRVLFKDVSMQLCLRNSASDAMVRQALIDRYGQPGTKKEPGLLYKVNEHSRSALAAAVVFRDYLAGMLPAHITL